MKFSCFSPSEIRLLCFESLPRTSKITSKKTRLCCCSFSLKVRAAILFPPQNTSSFCGVIPVNWVILHWYACGADGRSGVRSRDYQIFLPMVLRYHKTSTFSQLFYSHKMHLLALGTFYLRKWQISLPSLSYPASSFPLTSGREINCPTLLYTSTSEIPIPLSNIRGMKKVPVWGGASPYGSLFGVPTT